MTSSVITAFIVVLILFVIFTAFQKYTKKVIRDYVIGKRREGIKQKTKELEEIKRRRKEIGEEYEKAYTEYLSKYNDINGGDNKGKRE